MNKETTIKTIDNRELALPPSSLQWIGAMREYTVYVLKCQQNKYYVGVTFQPAKRLKAHNKGKGSLWTSLYKPIEVIYEQEIGAMHYFDAEVYEDYYTYLAIAKYGEDNVRGGHFTQVKPNDAEKRGQVRRVRIGYNAVKSL